MTFIVPTKKDEVHFAYGNSVGLAKDIATDLIFRWQSQTAKFAKEGRSLKDIWVWCRKNIKYRNDPKRFELVKSPNKTVADGGGDCDDFVVFCGTVLLNLNIDFVVRIADYGQGWQHIYIVANGQVLDPVNKVFNQEVKYMNKKDFRVKYGTRTVNLHQKRWNTAKTYGLGRIGINPFEARKKGSFVENGNEYKRQEPIKNFLRGKDTRIAFSLDVTVRGYYALIPAESLQPSHLGNLENPLHFIPESQPRNRAMSESGANTPIKIAENLRPAEISEGANAYTGAAVLNTRGEVIQGNGRAFTMKYYWQNFPNDPQQYVEYLNENLANIFGIRGVHIKDPKTYKIPYPVLVRIVDISDEEAIKLGQYKQGDLEAVATRADGIKQRINLLDDNDFSRVLENAFAQTTENDTLSEIIKKSNLISQLVRLGGIKAQELEIYLRNGEINEAGINEVKKILVNLIFKGEDTNLPNIFELLPVSIQTAITKASPYILRVSKDKSIKQDIAESVMAFRSYRSQSQNFKTIKEWANADGLLNPSPAKTYSKLALALANIYDKVSTQKDIILFFSKYQNAVSDQPATMFEGARKGIDKQNAIEIIFKDWFVSGVVVPVSKSVGGEKGTQNTKTIVNSSNMSYANEIYKNNEGAGGQKGATGEGILHEFFTPQYIADAMWKLAEKYGYDGGMVLEPSCGTGRLISPCKDYSKIVGFEINEENAKVAETKFVGSKIYAQHFETAFLKPERYTERYGKRGQLSTWLPDAPFSMVIGNPPYGIYKNAYSSYFPFEQKMAQVEVVFMYWGLKMLKENGLLVYITSQNFMRTGSKYQFAKKEIGQLCTFVDAIRLPSVFTNTEVPTDIIILKRNGKDTIG